jgi:hypothetical protein
VLVVFQAQQVKLAPKALGVGSRFALVPLHTRRARVSAQTEQEREEAVGVSQMFSFHTLKVMIDRTNMMEASDPVLSIQHKPYWFFKREKCLTMYKDV